LIKFTLLKLFLFYRYTYKILNFFKKFRFNKYFYLIIIILSKYSLNIHKYIHLQKKYIRRGKFFNLNYGGIRNGRHKKFKESF